MSYSNYNYGGEYEYWNNQRMYDNNNNIGNESSQFNYAHCPDVDGQSFPVIDVEAAVKGENKLGLKLTKTPSLLNIVDAFKSTNNSRGKNKYSDDNNDSSSSADKLKASNFSALSLQVGSWKKESRNEGDLVAKCYFKKRKLVWEVLDGNLKMKIEFLWSNILAIRQHTTCHDTKTTRLLEVLLERSPLFFREINPQPRKHTNWEQTNDFTNNNQGSLIRKHVLEFAPGILEKHFDKIINADPKLHRLSQQAWPNHISPYFHEIHFSKGIDDFHHPPHNFPSHRSFIPTISPQIGAMNDSLLDRPSSFCATTNYQSIQDTSYNQNMAPYQNNEQGELSTNNDYYDDHIHPQGLPNVYDNNNQSHYYTLSTNNNNNFGDMNNQQHGYTIQEEQQLSYEPNLPSYTTTYATSNTQDNVVYYQSNNDDYQYYHGVGGSSQW